VQRRWVWAEPKRGLAPRRQYGTNIKLKNNSKKYNYKTLYSAMNEHFVFTDYFDMPNDDLYNSVYFKVSSEFEEQLKNEIDIPVSKKEMQHIDIKTIHTVHAMFRFGSFYKEGSEERRKILEEIKILLGPDTKIFALKMIDIDYDFWWPRF